MGHFFFSNKGWGFLKEKGGYVRIPQETELSDSFPRTTWGLHLILVSPLVMMGGSKDVSFESPLEVGKKGQIFLFYFSSLNHTPVTFAWVM